MAVDPKNGNLTPAELTTVDGLPLAVPTANAYRRMQAAAKAAGVILWIAKPIGGYRSWFVQGDMAVHPALYGLNPASTVPVASPGWSTHGRGTRVDVGSFGSQWGADGAARSDWLIRNASRFGFYREFGVSDPNHFAHDGFTGTAPFPTDSTTTTASTGGVTPIQEGFLMALTDAEQTEALEHLRDLSAALGAGNARNPGVVPPAGDVLSNVRAAVSHTVDLKQAVAALPVPATAKDIAHTVWWDEGVDRGDRDANGNPVLVPMRQELADAKTNTIAIAATGPVDVDVDKLATALADRLKLDPAATATAVRDVLAGLTLTAHLGQ